MKLLNKNELSNISGGIGLNPFLNGIAGGLIGNFVASQVAPGNELVRYASIWLGVDVGVGISNWAYRNDNPIVVVVDGTI